MKRIKILFNITFLLITLVSFGQNETATIAIYPHWNKEDVHAVVIKTTTTDIVKEKPIVFLSTFNANFSVLEKTESQYVVEWMYTNAKVASNEPNFENNILAQLVYVKMKIKLSPLGKFIELINVDEIRAATNKVLDDLIAKETKPSMKMQYNSVKQLIGTNQGLEIVLLKQIKLYHFSFGYQYATNYEQVNNIKFPNPINGEPFDAVEKVKLVAVDFKNSICKIETSKIVEGAVFTQSVMEYLKRNNKEHIKEIESEFGKSIFEITEKSMQELNFEKGSLLKSSFQRKVNLGIQNRTVLMEIEAI